MSALTLHKIEHVPSPDPLPALYVPVLLQQRGERERERGKAIFSEFRAGA